MLLLPEDAPDGPLPEPAGLPEPIEPLEEEPPDVFPVDELPPEDEDEPPIEPLDEDPVEGDALGVEAPVPLVCTPSLVIVSESMRPVAFRPSAFWKSRSAAFVFGPITPSTEPGSCPLSLSACCTERTCSRWPPFAERDLPDFTPCSAVLVPDEPLPIDEEPVVPDIEPLLPVSVAEVPPVPDVPPVVDELPEPDDVEGLGDDDELPLPVEPPLDDCANAGPATSARAAVRARTLFHEFI